MIGLFLGEKKLPFEILNKLKKRKIKYFIIDLTKNNKFKKDKNSFFISIGKFGKILKLIKSKNCNKVIFAGNISKPKISKLKLDLKGIYYFPRIIKASKLGDAAILKEIIKILKEQKIKTVNSLSYNPELTLKKGFHSKVKPNKEDHKNIQKAIKVLRGLGNYSYSQGVVVRNKKVVAIESKDGTEQMLGRCKSKKENSGVLVKYPKKKQDLRIDLPTVGLNTFKQCKNAGIKGIILKNKQNIFLEKKACINFANKNKMFILVK